jgi:hypothetical protein
MTADIISLVGQSVGGGIADTAANKQASNKGVHIMVAGLAFQIVSMTFFVVLVLAFFLRVRKDLARQRATNWAAGKVDPPTAHVRGYSTFVWSILDLSHLLCQTLTSNSVRFRFLVHLDSFLLPCRRVGTRLRRQACQRRSPFHDPGGRHDDLGRLLDDCLPPWTLLRPGVEEEEGH